MTVKGFPITWLAHSSVIIQVVPTSLRVESVTKTAGRLRMTRQAPRQAVHVRMCVCTYTAVAHEQTIFVAMCNRLKTELTDCQQLYPGRTHCLLTPLSPFLSPSPLAIRISHTTIILSVNTLVGVICSTHTCRQRERGRIVVPNPLKCDVTSL